LGHKCKVSRAAHWSGGSGVDRLDKGNPRFTHVQTNKGEDLFESNEGKSVTTVVSVHLPHGADSMEALRSSTWPNGVQFVVFGRTGSRIYQ
jgi:hypothetical protein